MKERVNLIKGMIKGFEDMGAKFIKADDFNLYFDVKKGSEIDDEENLKRAKGAFLSSFGFGLKIRKV